MYIVYHFPKFKFQVATPNSLSLRRPPRYFIEGGGGGAGGGHAIIVIKITRLLGVHFGGPSPSQNVCTYLHISKEETCILDSVWDFAT